jgi:hypothetical protein
VCDEPQVPAAARREAGTAHVKARHFKFLVDVVGEWFPGRTISISMR